jgi:hypothetical protein
MNNKLIGLALALACAASLVAQEPPGCVDKTHTRKQLRTAQKSEIRGKLPKRKVLDLRRKPARKSQSAFESDRMPIIASPIYLPQAAGTANAAITASNGYLYVVVGQRLYKVNEKTLKTVQVSTLGRVESSTASDSEPPRHKRKIVASNDEPSPRKKTRGSKAD